MNFVLKEKRQDGGYFIISIMNDNPDGYFIRTKCIDKKGNITTWNDVSGDGFTKAHFKTLDEAKDRAKTIAANKRKKRDMNLFPQDALPDTVKAKLAAEVENQVSEVELLELVKMYQKERYVTLKNNVGFEGNFDVGVEYIGFLTEDPCILEVFDKYGKTMNISVSRLDTIVKTEQALKAEGVSI